MLNASGQCVEPVPATCAQAGQTPAAGQTCCTGLVLDGAGQCAQPAPPSCANSCSGCCNGETCVTNTNAAACGASGAPCGVCSGLHGTCFNGLCRCDVCASGCRFGSIQAAIDDPSALTTITVCEGTYAGNVTINRDLNLIGEGDGANPAFNTVLTGTANGSVVTTGASITVALQRLRITGGGNADKGGGILIGNGMVALTDCTVVGNQAVTQGAGIFNGGILSIESATVTNNTCTGSGGGIFNNSQLTATHLIVSDNVDAFGGGAGIANTQTLELHSSSVFRNILMAGGSGGGGILNSSSGTVTLVDSEVTHNFANSGGGIFQQGGITGSVTLTNSVVAGNDPDNCAPSGAVSGCS